MSVKLSPSTVEDAIMRVGNNGLLYAFADDLDLDEFKRGTHLEISTNTSASVRISASRRFQFVPVSIANSLASARVLKRSALWELAGLADYTYGVVHEYDWSQRRLLMEFYTVGVEDDLLFTAQRCRYFSGAPALKDGLIDALVWP